MVKSRFMVFCHCSQAQPDGDGEHGGEVETARWRGWGLSEVALPGLEAWIWHFPATWPSAEQFTSLGFVPHLYSSEWEEWWGLWRCKPRTTGDGTVRLFKVCAYSLPRSDPWSMMVISGTQKVWVQSPCDLGKSLPPLNPSLYRQNKEDPHPSLAHR